MAAVNNTTLLPMVGVRDMEVFPAGLTVISFPLLSGRVANGDLTYVSHFYIARVDTAANHGLLY